MENPSMPAMVIPATCARARLRTHRGDGLEAWLADQPWQPTEDGGWRVETDRDGWLFRIEAIAGGDLRIVARAPSDGATTAWLIAGGVQPI
jgi:hypothetical protein